MPLLRSELKVVTPAHTSGPASTGDNSSGDKSKGALVRNQVVLIAAVVGDAGHLAPIGKQEISAATGLTTSTVAAFPANSNSLSFAPGDYTWANCVDDAGDLVSRNAWVLDPGKCSFLGRRVAVADAASLGFDADLRGTGFGYLTFYNLERTIRLSNLHDSHFRHCPSSASESKCLLPASSPAPIRFAGANVCAPGS
jgi:hypothetical protein